MSDVIALLREWPKDHPEELMSVIRTLVFLIVGSNILTNLVNKLVMRRALKHLSEAEMREALFLIEQMEALKRDSVRERARKWANKKRIKVLKHQLDALLHPPDS
jgi:hypothetical protein